MFKSIYKNLRHNFHHPNYLVLMIGLILIVILPPFLELFYRGELILYFLFAATMLLGIFYTATSTKELIACFVLVD
jgi:hypothetical protein